MFEMQPQISTQMEKSTGTPAINIGSRLELFTDDYIIDTTTGKMQLKLHNPIPQDVAFLCDKPWEGNGSSYQSIVKDGDRYLFYYHGGHVYVSRENELEPRSYEILCVAESKDGLLWTRPDIGLVDFKGSRKNNIILVEEMVEEVGGSPAHSATFKDTNPDCPPNELFKMVMYGTKPHGLYLMVSSDGIQFQLKSKKPFMTYGMFDSQNLAFYDNARSEYRLYHRGYNGEVRDILTCAAKDFDSFSEPDWVMYPESPTMNLYTNQIAPYYRAPHILMGFPMRYCELGWAGPTFDLPGIEKRLHRAKYQSRYGMVVTDAVFMSSHDGVHFNRPAEAFLRPGPKQREAWVYGDNFICWGMIETPSRLNDAPDEISLYAVESYWEGEATRIRRYTVRVDGFMSANAPYAGGELVTKPFIFDGGSLAVNAATSAFGSFQIEIQHADGTSVKGFERGNCEPIHCDSLRYIVHWQNRCDLSQLAGQPIRLRFLLKDADIYSFQFVAKEPARKIYEMPKMNYIPPQNPDRESFNVMNDDFQSVKSGELPLVGDGDSGWLVYRSQDDRLRVMDDYGNHFLELNCVDETIETLPCARVLLKKQDVADSANNVIEVRSRLRMPKTNQSSVIITLFNPMQIRAVEEFLHVVFMPNGNIAIRTYDYIPEATSKERRESPWFLQEPEIIKGLSFVSDEWFNFMMRIDMEQKIVDYSINNDSVQGLPFAKDDVSRLQSVVVYPESVNTMLQMADINIDVIVK